MAPPVSPSSFFFLRSDVDGGLLDRDTTTSVGYAALSSAPSVSSSVPTFLMSVPAVCAA